MVREAAAERPPFSFGAPYRRVNHIEGLCASARAGLQPPPASYVICGKIVAGLFGPTEIQMTLGTILLIILILLLIGGLPTWGYSRSWGYAPSGGLGVILLIVIILLLMGRI